MYNNSLASNGQPGEKIGERQCVLLVQTENRGIIANEKDHWNKRAARKKTKQQIEGKAEYVGVQYFSNNIFTRQGPIVVTYAELYKTS